MWQAIGCIRIVLQLESHFTEIVIAGFIGHIHIDDCHIELPVADIRTGKLSAGFQCIWPKAELQIGFGSTIVLCTVIEVFGPNGDPTSTRHDHGS